MGAVSIQQMADRIAALMEEKLAIKGVSLGQKISRGGQLLPSAVRREAQELARLADMAKNPKLVTQIDEGRVAEAYDACIKHLNTVNPADLRKGAAMGIVLSIVGSLLLLAVLVIAILMWRGYL